MGEELKKADIREVVKNQGQGFMYTKAEKMHMREKIIETIRRKK